MHTIEEAKKLQCRVVGMFTTQERTKLPGSIVGMNGAHEAVAIKIQTLQCCANECGHWVVGTPDCDLDGNKIARGHCGLAR